MESPGNVRRVRRVRHELRRRELEVARVEAIGPGFVAVTFRGESLADFVSEGFDDHVKLMLEVPGGEPVRRDYTPRRFDRERRELTLEFALHAQGETSAWARQARPGQEVAIGGPRGSMIVPLDYDWHLLAGDATALPAIRRRLEELPQGTCVIVVAQLDEADRRALTAPAGVALHWVDGPEGLIDAVRRMPLPPGEGFVWAAGEASAMARLREVLLLEKHHPREAMRIAAYWKRGVTAHHENFED